MDSESYLNILNPEQRKAVVHEGTPLLILAGAGSGKTRVITTKIAYLIAEKHIDPFSILAVTFTKKAANEMKERAIALEPKASYAQIRTFHSWGAYFLRTYSSQAGVDKNFTVYDDDDMVTLVSKAVPSLSKQQASLAAHKISLAKDYCYSPDNPELYTISEDPAFPEIYASYEKRLRETGNVDFGDLIMLPYLVLKTNPEVRHEMHRRYKVLMVDEYQDSNVAQFKLLYALSGIEEDSRTYVCVVGDDDQSIYKFRGADIHNILNFQNQFPDTTLVRLETNYRSTSEILACADSVVKNNNGRLGKTLVSARGNGKTPALVFLPTQEDETQFCAEMIEQSFSKGTPYKDWAILYRTNAQSLGFETEFLHRKIPYTIVGSLKFYEREEVKDILSWISLIANPRDEIAFRRIVNKPARGIGNVSQDKIISASSGLSLLEGYKKTKLSKKVMEGMELFCESIHECCSVLSESDSSEKQEKLSLFIETIVKKSGLEEYYTAQDEISGTQKAANLQELANSAVLYPCTMKGLLDFMDHVQLDRTLNNEDESSLQDSVTLITLHNTKGLEFPRVVITGMESGIFPREDKTGEEIEEERRLFYVGITRAKNELYLTSCAIRRLYGRTNYMSPSPFLNEIEENQIRVIGEKPLSFTLGGKTENPIIKKYKKGTCVYHDDYGHGQIIQTEMTDDDEYVVSVKFETGTFAKFLPEYQSKSLLIEE